MRTHTAFVACFVAVVACQAPVSDEETAEPTPDAPLDFAIVGDGPVIEPEQFDAAYLLPGAAVAHDGVYHLYPVAFQADPAEAPRVLHLTSDDGTSWDGDPDASVLGDFALALDDIGAVPSSAFVDADGTWVMYGGGRLPDGSQPIIWRATAPGPDGPWAAHPEAVLEPSDGEWDGRIADHPSVIPTGTGYLMAYGGASQAQPNRGRIGLATSDDGISWTRVAASLEGADDDEALGPSACGIDARSMVEPHLLSADDAHRLVFGAMVTDTDNVMQVGSATTGDGLDWTCSPNEPIVTPEEFPLAPSLHSFVVFDDGDASTMLVEVLGNARSDIWLARSRD